MRRTVKGIHRARLALVAGAALSLTIVGVELPLGTLVHQRGAIAAAAERLASVRAENTALAHQVAALKRPASVARIAHGEYGLVHPGQQAYAILPAKGGTDAGALAAGPVASTDLVPPAVSPFGSPTAAPSRASRAPAGLWTRVVNRLEFWHSAF